MASEPLNIDSSFTVVANFDIGITFSPDGKLVYITDTGAHHGFFGYDAARPATMYVAYPGHSTPLLQHLHKSANRLHHRTATASMSRATAHLRTESPLPLPTAESPTVRLSYYETEPLLMEYN